MMTLEHESTLKRQGAFEALKELRLFLLHCAVDNTLQKEFWGLRWSIESITRRLAELESEKTKDIAPLTILEQFTRSSEEGEGDVVCPKCKQEVGQYYDEDFTATQLLDAGKCPFCDCAGIGGHEYEWRGRCDDCPNKMDCEEEDQGARDFADERSRELFSYQCTGGLCLA